MVRKILVAALMAAALLATVTLLSARTAPAGFAGGLENIENASWQLVVDGSVRDPVTITYKELLAMPSVTEQAGIICVDAAGLANIVESSWTGVPLKAILEKAGVDDNAVKVAFYAIDGYSTDLDMETAMRQDTLVGYKNDNGLASTWSGNPSLRLVVPDHWGYKWINNLDRISVVDYDYKGLWESKGYPDDGLISSN